MLFLSLKITSINLEASTQKRDEDALQANPDANASKPLPENEVPEGNQSPFISTRELYFAVHPDDRDRIDLETGEVFVDPKYGRKDKSISAQLVKSISAQLNVIEVATELDLSYGNWMTYFDRVGDPGDETYRPSSIEFNVVLPPRDFNNLLTNIQNGILPKVDLQLEGGGKHPHGPLRYGSDPNTLIWLNKAHDGHFVKIEKITFQYEILKPAKRREVVVGHSRGEKRSHRQSPPAKPGAAT
jgi:hypothetical protein